MEKEVIKFLETACKRADYNPALTILVVTAREDVFDDIRKAVHNICLTALKASWASDNGDFDEFSVEPVSTVWLTPNDEFTPRGHSSIAAIVDAETKPTPGTVKAIALSLADKSRSLKLDVKSMILEASLFGGYSRNDWTSDDPKESA